MKIAWKMPSLAASLLVLIASGIAAGQNQAQEQPAGQPEVTETTETVITTTATTENWDIVGPIRLRSADPEDLGQIEWKHTVHWGTSSDGSDDDIEVLQEIEWGFAPNHELSLSVPVELGDGGVDGNADILIGWQWRLWKEDPCREWLPAFAIRNILRVPSGYHSSGVDWTLMGLITKSIVPNKFRLHANPFLTSANGDNLEANRGEESTSVMSRATGLTRGTPRHRYFRWGAILGADYRLNECMSLIADYVHETADLKGWRNQHSAEIGLDWKLSRHQQLGIVARVGLDGDSIGENVGMGFSYILTFDPGPLVRCD